MSRKIERMPPTADETFRIAVQGMVRRHPTWVRIKLAKDYANAHLSQNFSTTELTALGIKCTQWRDEFNNGRKDISNAGGRGPKPTATSKINTKMVVKMLINQIWKTFDIEKCVKYCKEMPAKIWAVNINEGITQLRKIGMMLKNGYIDNVYLFYYLTLILNNIIL